MSGSFFLPLLSTRQFQVQTQQLERLWYLLIQRCLGERVSFLPSYHF